MNAVVRIGKWHDQESHEITDTGLTSLRLWLDAQPRDAVVKVRVFELQRLLELTLQARATARQSVTDEVSHG